MSFEIIIFICHLFIHITFNHLAKVLFTGKCKNINHVSKLKIIRETEMGTIHFPTSCPCKIANSSLYIVVTRHSHHLVLLRINFNYQFQDNLGG